MVALLSAGPAGAAPSIERAVADFRAAHDVPGIVGVVVRSDGVVAAFGDGLADVEAGVPMDAERTVVRIGAISQTMTAIAALQLVEEGSLDLDGDVDARLVMPRVPPVFAEPVTLRRLLTHTAGLRELVLGTRVHEPAELESVTSRLAREPPTPLRPPGGEPIDRSYGFALVAVLVERLGREPFGERLAHRLFEPLDMRRTTLRETPPERDVARGYADGKPVAAELLNPAPPEGVLSTAADMGRFMRALLGGATPALLAPQLPTAVPGAAVGFGVVHVDVGGRAVVEQGGRTHGFEASMTLVPDAGLGIFLAANREGAPLETLRAELLDVVLGPVTPRAVRPAAEPSDEDVAGWYRDQRFDDSQLHLIDVWRAERLETRPLRWKGHALVEVAPLTFADASGVTRLVLQREQGRLVLVDGMEPAATKVRLGWHQTARVWGTTLALGAALLLGLLGIGAVRLRHEDLGSTAWAALSLAAAGAVLALLVPAILLGTGLRETYDYGPTLLVDWAMRLPFVAWVLVALGLFLSVLGEHPLPPRWRWWHGAVTVVTSVLVWCAAEAGWMRWSP